MKINKWKIFDYLNLLKKYGVPNSPRIPSYIQEEFKLGRQEAKKVHEEWMIIGKANNPCE